MPRLLLTSALVTLAALICACAIPGAPQPPSLKLPKPARNLKAERKADKVQLSWTAPRETTDEENIDAFGSARICRSLASPMEGCDQVVSEIPATQIQAGKRLDVVVEQNNTADPLATATYAVEMTNDRGRSAGLSNRVEIPMAPTGPPPTDLRAEVTAEGVLLHWRPADPPRVRDGLRYTYRLYKRQQGAQAAVLVAEVPPDLSETSNASDQNFEWEQSYDYWITPVTYVLRPGKAAAEVHGADSTPVRVEVRDKFPPAAPAGVQGVYFAGTQPGFIDLTWAPNAESDLAGYNVYRREGDKPPVKLNTEATKAPAFRDERVTPGAAYTYSVSAVDLRNNESERSEESSTVEAK
jgi:hypothetical protein